MPSTVNVLTPRRSTSGPSHSRSRCSVREVVDLSVEVREQTLLVRADVGHPRASEHGARGAERDGADHVGAARLVAVRQRRPLHVVGGDVGHGAAAGQHRLGVGEHRRWSDQHTAAERRVHLVAGQSEEVDAHGHHVDRSVRRQLRGVDCEQRAVLVREPADLCDGEDLAGDVARPGDRDDADGPVAVFERAAQVGEQLLGRLRGIEELDPREAAPGQHVRVVLDDRAEHRRAPGAAPGSASGG